MDLPPRAQYDVEAIPDSIEVAPNTDKWTHTICAGLLPFAAAAAGRDPNFKLGEEGSIEDVKKAIAEECVAFQRIDNELRDKLKTLESELRKLYPEADSEFAQLLDRCFEKLGAYRSLYFQQYTGGQYREVLKQIDRLRTLLRHETHGDLTADGAVHNVLRALELLGHVQGFTVARHLSEDEIDQLEATTNELRGHLMQSLPNLKPGHKFHIILKHLVPFARRWKTINLFSEQAIESAHNVINRMATRITSRDKRMKLSLIMRWFKEQNILIDQYGTVSGTE
ncbi:Protein F16B4.3 [Aphelenchoides avenae]|nr:Protein F16B4.3 [Aphelenchus avenae]